MDASVESITVRQITSADSARLPALHLALDADAPTPRGMARDVKDLISRSTVGNVSIDLLFGAFRGDQLLSAAVAAESPGGAAMVLLPCKKLTTTATEATVAVLRHLQQAAWNRSIRLLEVLVAPDVAHTATILTRAGFRRLTQLLYLTRSSHEPNRSPSSETGLTWVPYSPEATPLFCRALEASYSQSLDCPELTGLRPTLDVLVGHRSIGRFDPKLWWVVTRGNEPAGVLLLNPIPPHPTAEIVYLGVAQASRGTGVADALLHRAVLETRQMGVKTLSLAVDIRNEPARRMYARWQFSEILARDAFVATPEHAEC